MNYVKHLSIALLVLGTASVQAAGGKWTTPGGTELTWDAGANKWTHPAIAPNGAREKHVLAGDIKAPTLKDDKGADVKLTFTADPVAKTYATPGKTQLVYDAAKKEYSHPEIKAGGKRENHKLATDAKTLVPTLKDDKGADVKLDEVAAAKTILNTIKEYAWDKTWGTQGTLAGKAISVGVVAGIYAGAYKLSPAVKDFTDDAVEKGQNFINDVKDGNGNARRNAGIALAVAAGAAVGGYRYQTGKWHPWA